MNTDNQTDTIRDFAIRKGHGDVFGVWQRGELIGAFPCEEAAATWIAKLHRRGASPMQQQPFEGERT